MCVPFNPLDSLPLIDPWHGGPTQRSLQTLNPPKPLPWYYRDPLGALVVAAGLVLAGYLVFKVASLL